MKEKTCSPTEAEAKLVDFCKKEGAVDITARQVGRTEWIYLALDEPIFDVKADSSKDDPKRKIMPFSLLSLETGFDNRTFTIRYDIVPEVLSPEPTTYGSSYNETYTKKRQLIYQGVQETFLNLAKDEETRAAAPVFFVIIIADAKKGIATKSTFYLPDLKAYLAEAIPFEEYYLRESTEILGDEKLIGDRTGKNLKTYEVTWPDFLTAQIKTRVRFKFTQSDFKPTTDPDKEIIGIVANTLRFYPFQDFDAVILTNTREKRDMNFNKDQLETFKEEPLWQKDKGKITVIKFQLPKIPPGSSAESDPNPDDSLPEANQ